jgi:hypothetical protein
MARGRRIIALFFVFLAGGLFAAVPAGAQFQETEGIRFGAFSIHPSVYTALRYSDNVYFLPTDYRPIDERSIPQSIESDFLYNVTPAIRFDLSFPTFLMNAGYRYYNDSYLGYDDPDNNHNLLNGSNHMATGLLDYNAPFGLMIGASEAWTKTQIYEPTDQFIDFVRGEQVHNDARGWLGWKSGPYESIYFKATYINLIDQFDRFRVYDKMSHYVDGNLRLKFYPMTAVVADGGYGWVEHKRLADSDSKSWYAEAGLQGQLATFLNIIAKGGWGMANYVTGPSFSGYIAQGELAWLFPGNAQWAFGYKRYFQDASDTNYFTSHEGYTRFSKLWGSKFNTELAANYQYVDYSDPLARHEDLLLGTIDLTYRLVYWLYLGPGYEIDYRLQKFPEQPRTTTVRNIYMVHLEAKF